MSVKLFIPDDAAALSIGADKVAAALAGEAKRLGIDLHIVRNGSRGMLWLEPLVEWESTDGRMAFGPVRLGDASALLAAILGDGRHPLALGPTEEIPYLKHQERLTFARVGLIDPHSLADYETHGGLAGLRAALKMTPEQICETVLDSGLRGRGGAGFPAGIKWHTVRKQDSTEKYICCNADEGDSGTFADRMLMEGDPFTLLEGMVIAGIATGAREGMVYIRSEYPHAIAKMKRAIEVLETAGWLGEGSSMLNSIEGKRGTVRSKPPIPAIHGLFGKPTVVNNVLTLATVPIILARGAAFYKEFGVGRSHGTQAFQLARSG